jgi:putative PIN family toxin of toxin-antitoxin system
MRAVLDTNVVVSAFLSQSGAPARVMELLAREAYVLLVSEPILDEYHRALAYEKVRARHGLDEAALTAVIDDLAAVSVLVEPEESLRVVEPDAADDKFFECAVAGGADYVVSGDAAVLAVGEYRGIAVVSPAIFVELAGRGLG